MRLQVPSFHPGITNGRLPNLPWLKTDGPRINEPDLGTHPWNSGCLAGGSFAHTGMITLHIPPEHIESGAITSRDKANDVVIVEMHLQGPLTPIWR